MNILYQMDFISYQALCQISVRKPIIGHCSVYTMTLCEVSVRKSTIRHFSVYTMTLCQMSVRKPSIGHFSVCTQWHCTVDIYIIVLMCFIHKSRNVTTARNK